MRGNRRIKKSKISKGLIAQGQTPYKVQCQWINDPVSSKKKFFILEVLVIKKKKITASDLLGEIFHPKWFKCKKCSHLNEFFRVVFLYESDR